MINKHSSVNYSYKDETFTEYWGEKRRYSGRSQSGWPGTGVYSNTIFILDKS